MLQCINSHKIMSLIYLDTVQKCISLYKCAKIAERILIFKVCLNRRVNGSPPCHNHVFKCSVIFEF